MDIGIVIHFVSFFIFMDNPCDVAAEGAWRKAIATQNEQKIASASETPINLYRGTRAFVLMHFMRNAFLCETNELALVMNISIRTLIPWLGPTLSKLSKKKFSVDNRWYRVRSLRGRGDQGGDREEPQNSSQTKGLRY